MGASGKARKILIIAAAGLVACGIKLWAELAPNDPIVFSNASASSDPLPSPEPLQTTVSDITSSFSEKTEPAPITIPVYICGYVLCPGIYEITSGTYLYEVIEMAGGLLDNAARENINLVFLLEEPVAIYIPSVDDVANGVVTSDGNTSSFLRNPNEVVVWGEDNESNDNATGQPQQTEKVNINTADQAQLETLPGVGTSTAAAIIKYRETIGLFQSIDDIMKVSGIKEGRFEAIRDYIMV